MTAKKECTVILDGCDDSTEMNISLSDDEIALLTRISKISLQVSTYQCMPRLEIEIKEAT